MKKILLSIILLVLTGCGGQISPKLIDGDNIQTIHGVYRVNDALEGAIAYCELRSKKVKFIKSDCSETTCVSSYQCINKWSKN